MPNLALMLFVAGRDTATERLLSALKSALEAVYPGGVGYRLDVVDVLTMPEKALENDVFATPMLLRNLPLPVLKVLGDVAQTSKIMALVQDTEAPGNGIIV